ncbi:hypothetical protein P9E76_13620 [Schinkia azotoformans]|uniref:Molybdopterin cofactor biosynthesis MoaD-related C-terminal domain-containing protein n=1 Tax=Schinkia azotoformans LMG 9581 TaxID=1131731 RepID=K6DJA2_SCHAZ|nr:hypothetical protein [Schinkia azotoformans]EKN68399.1 hypothetical protein BAZO_05135 [Schinkia azotoformans LMG 9581]MEC1638488.1 hypothetical protein [Schinkia azotoformans]MEC1721345.1 hypothetical protein [Schinkia azotoformans]MEC1946078.1 hypothetical protein [Schinkia azotoformans]MED4351580.1 hypothetical protein [Schinkia azotoformans]
MVQTELEFRGIHLAHLLDYFKELGGTQKTTQFPIIIQGTNWESSILYEEEIKITSSFFVNAVHIRFKAETEEVLDTLLKNYRKKTTRVGG